MRAATSAGVGGPRETIIFTKEGSMWFSERALCS